MSRSLSVCVYCAASDTIAPAYNHAADALGRALAAAGHTLVYGGGSVGLMGHVARGVHAGGGRVVGVIPQFMIDKELAYKEADELIITDTMRQRKDRMESLSDAFIAAPGGFGTLEELIEIITGRKLLLHDKPLVLLNVEGFYQPLVALFDHFIAQKFGDPSHRNIWSVADTVDDAMAQLSGI